MNIGVAAGDTCWMIWCEQVVEVSFVAQYEAAKEQSRFVVQWGNDPKVVREGELFARQSWACCELASRLQRDAIRDMERACKLQKRAQECVTKEPAESPPRSGSNEPAASEEGSE